MSKKFILALILFFAVFNQLSAQVKDEPIEVKTCAIDVRANMFTATTTLQLEFYNPNAKVLDGEYSFALQAGQVITGFALDINGFLREGVIVDKQQGRVAYENTIRRRVDPGLLEMTAGNNYRVRIYPMPAKGTRKIKIIISQLLVNKANKLQYDLPLDIPYKVQELKITLNIDRSIEAPVALDGLLKDKKFEKENDNYHLNFTEKNLEIKQPLSFQIPFLQNKKIFCMGQQDSKNIFALHLIPEAAANIAQPALNTATIFWDVSSSSTKRNVQKELGFLEMFLKEKKISTISIVTFSNAIHDTRNFKANELGAIKRFLQSQQADGGTQLGSIDCNMYSSDVFIVCSDGLSNFGNDKIKMNSKPVYCINSSSSANHSLLKKIAAKSGGTYIDLFTTSIEESEREIKSASMQLLAVKQAGKAIETNVILPFQFSTGITITGTLRNSKDDLTLLFGKDGAILKEEKIMLQPSPTCSKNNLDTAFLLQQYESLQNNDTEKDRIISIAKFNRFVSASTSFIVLDNVDDYIQYGIEPPADLQQEYLKKIYVVKQKAAQLKLDIENEEINNLRKAVTTYNERISWWGTDQKLISLKDIEQKKEPLLASNKPVEKTNPGGDKNKNITANAEGSFKFSNNNLNEVVVVGYGTQRRRDLTGSVATVSASQISRSGAMTVTQALQGRVAGVQVIQNTAPGGADKIIIRGVSSFNQNNQPLYVLDGSIIDATTINSLNVNDIENISVFKDAQASILYGSAGANGVIVITTKRGNRNTYKPGIPKYKDMDDVEYVTELKELDKNESYQRYLNMKDSMGKNPAFYFDVAEVFFKSGSKENAVRVLSNLAEMDNENHQLLRAMGYMLETWKMYAAAIDVYKKVLEIKEEEPQSYRDLALAYEHNQQYQQSVDLLYKITTKNFFQYEDRYRGLKSLLLNEMNAIISRHRDSLDLSAINNSIIKPLPVDIRVVIDWNKDETDIDLNIIEPGGEECFFSHKQTQAGGRLSEDFTQGYGPEEYQIKHAKKGKYLVRVKYYGDRYQRERVPSFIKLTIYKNFGKLNQTMTTESFLMDKQDGIIEMGEIKIQ